jgi:hypothetical protein
MHKPNKHDAESYALDLTALDMSNTYKATAEDARHFLSRLATAASDDVVKQLNALHANVSDDVAAAIASMFVLSCTSTVVKTAMQAAAKRFAATLTSSHPPQDKLQHFAEMNAAAVEISLDTFMSFLTSLLAIDRLTARAENAEQAIRDTERDAEQAMARLVSTMRQPSVN